MEHKGNKFKVPIHWQFALLKTMKNPNAIITSDSLVTVIKDYYPKAEVHYLVLPKADIKDLKSLTRNHIHLLKHMENVAREVTNIERHKNRHFLVGFHAEPSMYQLHMHVISDDLNSQFLKTKRHWNSFTTKFFISPSDVWKSIEQHGHVCVLTSAECQAYLQVPLRCHKCQYVPKNIPELKNHILIHR